MPRPTQQQRVDAGAAWLDKTDPGWWQPNRFDLGNFDLSNCDRCVLGQIIRTHDPRPLVNFWDCIEHLGRSPSDAAKVAGLTLTRDQAVRRGFHLYHNEGDPTWRSLTERWRTLIAGRRAP